jgi:hypothetical protein
MATCKVSVFVIVSSDGEYACGVDIDDAIASYDNDYGDAVRRVIELVVDVPVPTVTVLEGTCPAEQEVGKLLVK